MRTQTIEPFYPIWCPAFRGHSPVNGAFIKEPSIPLDVELSPVYVTSKFIKPTRPTGGILDTIA